MDWIIFPVLIGFIFWLVFRNKSSSSRQRTNSKQRKSRSDRSKRVGPSISIEVRSESRRQDAKERNSFAESREAWIPKGQSVTVQGRTIASGMIYVGDEMTAVDRNWQADPALIKPDLEARQGQTDIEGKNLGYWPSYSEITAKSRGAYLDWLASGRRDPEYNIGYVFLFFYGIERRILFDTAKIDGAIEEVPALLEELDALLRVYGPQNNSFKGYCEELIAYTRRSFGLAQSVTSPEYEPGDNKYRMSEPERLALGRMLAKGELVPPEWALAWVRGGMGIRMRTPGSRCREEFDALFLRRYNDYFGGEPVFNGSQRAMQVTYRPASSGIRRTKKQKMEDAVDVLHMNEPPKKLERYVRTLENDLDAYSRWIGRRDERKSLAALGQLPQELIRERDSESATAFVKQIESWLSGGEHAVIPTEDLLSHWPSKNDDYLTKTEAEALSGFLAGFDFGIEPDVRYTRNPSKRDHLTLFRLQGPDEPPGESFESARLLMHLSAAIASADDDVSREEEEHIEHHLEESLHLTLNERARLRAYVERLLQHPPTLRGVRRRAKSLDFEKRRQLATFLLTLAGADGYLDGEEIIVIEKVYDMLGFDSDQVHQDLHKLSARQPGQKDEGPVTVIEPDSSSNDYQIPSKEKAPQGPAETSESGFQLDLDRVASIQEETKNVAQVLDDVFSDEEDNPPSFSVDGLTDEHETLIAELSTQPEWPRSEFEERAESHGLMPGFAIEQINDRAFEVADEPLLEGWDPVEINSYALDALQS